MTWEPLEDGGSRCQIATAGEPSLERVLALVAEAVDESLERHLEQQEIVLRDWGATDEELEAVLRDVHLEALRRKREVLASVRRRLVD